MSYIRWSIDLAVKEPITKELEAEMDELKARLILFREQCSIINEGLPNEENTKRMDEHICNHDIGEACGPKTDIGDESYL